jgi:hypothetical protein
MMEGFYFYDDLNEPSFPVDPVSLSVMALAGRIELPSIEEINDKSKSNGLFEALVLLQASWFITQCIARALYSMHVSKMELLTLGYISMALCIYIVFWDKPRKVCQPFRIPSSLDGSTNRRSAEWPLSERLSDLLLGFEYGTFQESKSVPPFWAENYNHQYLQVSLKPLLVGIAFAGINCIAWSYETSTTPELVLWRLSSLAGPGFQILTKSALVFINKVERRSVSELLMNHLLILLALLYAILRVASIVLAVRELSMTFEGMYRVVQWTDFIPHI